jgi:hypothetical protein
MLNIRLAVREDWEGAFPAFSGFSMTCNFSLLPALFRSYHSRLARSWAAVGYCISIIYSCSPIPAAHCPWPVYTGSMGTQAYVTAYPRWKNNGGRHQFAYSECKSCLVNLLHHSFRWMPENRQPPPFGYSKLPVTTNQPGSVFQYQVLRQRIFASFMVHYATPASSSWSFQGFMWPLHSAPVGIKPLIC